MAGDFDETLYRDIFETAPDPIMVHDPETGDVVHANPAACDLLGLDYDSLVGSQVGSFSPAGFTSADARAAIEAAPTDGAARVDWSVQTADGEQRWVDVTLKRARAGGQARVIAFIRDVSERREREREHAQWYEQIQTLVNNLPVVVFALDPDGEFTYSAGKGLEALGLEQGAVVGDSVFEVYADYSEILDAARRALDGEEVRVTQSIDDHVFETWYRPVFEDGQLVQVVGVARDVTEPRLREERVDTLSEATNDLLYTHTEAAVAERVTDIAEHIIDRPIAAMWSYDPTGDRLYPIGATATAMELAGVNLAKDLAEMGADTDEKAIFDAEEPVVIDDYGELEAPSAPGIPLGTMLCLPLDDHGLLCIGSREVEPFSESERHLLDILSSTATAALDRVSRETELESQRAALEASNEALQGRREQMEFFNSILRHDILNGMTVIRARGELLSSSLEGEQGRYAETIVEWSDDIIELTRKVRSVLHTLSDDDAAETEPVELAPVVESAARRATSMATRATFDVDVPDDIYVRADELLHDVFGNVLTNAVEHGSGDAGVSVNVTTTLDEDHVTVHIVDDGPGIAPSVRGELFDRGKKGRESGGTGFGLYFVHAMVESYGGSIQVEENDSGGAAFGIQLPRAA